ncbi:MAG TPA: hypothetical protein PKI99_00680 [Terrimesophilobacter sp.]|nr:hypothetical protein [Terrimesophilobacter sp.]
MAHLNENLMKLAEFGRVIYLAAPPAGTALEAMLKPDYWAHVGYKLKPGDRIEVVPEDMAFFAELFVRDAGRLFAHMHVIRHEEFAERGSSVSVGEYSVGWGGPVHRFRVIRDSDGAVVKHGFADRDAALRFIKTMEPVAA